MSEPSPTVASSQRDLPAHTPMMAQYMGVTYFSNIHNTFSPIVNFTVPS